MSFRLWGRVFKLATGQSGGKAAIFSGHDFNCSVSYGSNAEPATCSGSLRFLSEDTLNNFIEVSLPVFYVEAGYTGFSGTVFSGIPSLGGVIKKNDKGSPSLEFKLISGSVIPSNVNISEPPGTKVFDLINTLCNDQGYTLKTYKGSRITAVPRGFSINGSFFTSIKTLADFINCNVILADDTVSIIPFDQDLFDGPDYILTSDNNCIFSFAISVDKEKGTVYKVTTVVIHSLRPGSYVRCDIKDRGSGKISQYTIRVTSVNFDLSSSGSPFNMSFEGVRG
jgi:hypothetical protein